MVALPTVAPPRAGVRLGAESRARYARDGFLVIPCAFSAPEVARAEAAFDRLCARGRTLPRTAEVDGATFVIAPSGPGREARLQRVVWCGAAEPLLGAIGLDPRVLGVALELLGEPSVDQLVNQAHPKAPLDGVEFPLHQDAWNRRVGTALWRDRSPDGGYVQALLTLDPMTDDRGPLLVVPGSHRLGPLLGVDREARLEAIVRAQPPVAITAPAGSLVFFGPFLVHGSAPNRGSGPRRVLVNGYARPGVNRRRYPGAGFGTRRSEPRPLL